ncbi:MAG: radical SAM protein [Candidatus Thorarchaeota archaeon]|nr:radical SAM protein [Candidatus Thorarchaeota archaeon]
MRYERIKAKSLLSKPITADGWFHINRSMNAYRGCEHGCVYCDGMSESYHVDDFLTHVRIKENAAQVLRRELKKAGFTSRTELQTETLWSFLDEEDAKRLAMKSPRKQVVGVCGGVSDGYQPAEKEHEITRQVLEILLDFEMPVFVLTKSDLVLRDLDLLKKIHEVAFADVLFTITLADDEVQRIFEPRASTTSERYKALKRVRKEGLFGGVMATPIIPGIGDTYENMRGLAKKAKRADAQFILWGGMTLKPGRQKSHFLNVVRKRFPEKLELLERIYRKNHPYGHPDHNELPVNIMLRGYEICRDVEISDRTIRHRLPNEPATNNKVLGALLDIVFRQTYLLGMSWNKSTPYRELALRIEKGIGDLNKMREEGELAERLMIDSQLLSTVEEILDTGSCQVLDDIHIRLDELVSRNDA